MGKLKNALHDALRNAVHKHDGMDKAIDRHTQDWKSRYGNELRIMDETGTKPAEGLRPSTPPPMLIRTGGLQKSIRNEVFEPKIKDGKWVISAESFTTHELFHFHEFGFTHPSAGWIKPRTTLLPTRLETSPKINEIATRGFMEVFAKEFVNEATEKKRKA